MNVEVLDPTSQAADTGSFTRNPEQQVLEVAKIAEEPPVVDDVPHLVVVRGTRDSWSIRTHTWLGSWVYGGLFG